MQFQALVAFARQKSSKRVLRLGTNAAFRAVAVQAVRRDMLLARSRDSWLCCLETAEYAVPMVGKLNSSGNLILLQRVFYFWPLYMLPIYGPGRLILLRYGD